MNINTIDNLVDKFYQNKTSNGFIQIDELCTLKEKIIKENVDKIINEQSCFETFVNSDENKKCLYLYKSIHDNKLYVIYSEQEKIIHIEPISMEKLVKTIETKNQEKQEPKNQEKQEPKNQEEKNREMVATTFVEKMVNANYKYMDENEQYKK